MAVSAEGHVGPYRLHSSALHIGGLGVHWVALLSNPACDGHLGPFTPLEAGSSVLGDTLLRGKDEHIHRAQGYRNIAI